LYKIRKNKNMNDNDNNKGKTPVPMPQRLRDFLRETVNREENGSGRRGILAPLAEIAGKEALSPEDADYLFLNYNLSRKFMRTGKGYPFNKFHEDPRVVVDFNGDAYRKTYINLFRQITPAPVDIQDLVDFVRSNYDAKDLSDDIKESLDYLEERLERYYAISDEMVEKIDALGDENIPTYCMSKAALLGYVALATEIISLYQEIYELMADLFGMNEWLASIEGEDEDGDEDGGDSDVALLASFRKRDEYPN